MLITIFKQLFVLDCQRYVDRWTFYHNIYTQKPQLDEKTLNELMSPIPHYLNQSYLHMLLYNYHRDYFEKLFLHTFFLFTCSLPFYSFPYLLLFIPLFYFGLCLLLNIIISFIEIYQSQKILKECYAYYQHFMI